MKNYIFYPTYTGRTSWALLLLRLVLGAAFILHGAVKIAHPFSWMGPVPVPGVLQGLAALSEFGGGMAMILGLLTPLAALGILCTMSFALLFVHFPMHHAFVAIDPTQHSFELPLLYWVIMVLYLLVGPGTFSIDALLFKWRQDR